MSPNNEYRSALGAVRWDRFGDPDAPSHDLEDVLLDAVGVGLVLDEPELLRVLAGVAEQALPGAEQTDS
ncbi:hypothetical protein GCM10010182_27970 [Actinomadura cremea]|nr:hypothetical protein GCM10010182_27970 [Actinomadura cremea]